MAQHLHHQPGAVTATAAGVGECEFWRLHTRLHADEVADVVLQTLVDGDDEVVGSLGGQGHAVHKGLEARRDRALDEVGRQLLRQVGRVGKRVVLGLGFQKKIEGVVDSHLGHQVHRDLELFGFVGKDQTRQVVGKRVLLPVHKMLLGFDTQRIAEDARAAMGRRAQTHHLRRELHRLAVAVVRDVVQCNVNGQGSLLVVWPRYASTAPGRGVRAVPGQLDDASSDAEFRVRSVHR